MIKRPEKVSKGRDSSHNDDDRPSSEQWNELDSSNFFPTSCRLSTLVVGSSTVMMESFHYLKEKRSWKIFSVTPRKFEDFPHRGSVRSFIFHPPQRGNHDIERQDVQRRGKCFKKEKLNSYQKENIWKKRKKSWKLSTQNLCKSFSLTFLCYYFMLGNFIFNFFSTPLCHEFIRRWRRKSKTEQKKLKEKKSLKVREKNSAQNFIQLSVNFML